MKDNYDFSKMRKVPHPLLGKEKKITDNVGGVSDEEFERKLQDLEPDERDIAIRVRAIFRQMAALCYKHPINR